MERGFEGKVVLVIGGAYGTGRAAAIWLCSDEASYVTGHALPVDGGLVAD